MTPTESTAPDRGTPSPLGWPASWPARALTLFGLFGLGIAQPLLDLYGSNPEVFIANRSSPGQVLAFALIATVVPPLVALGLIWMAERINAQAGRLVTTTLVAIAGFLAVSAVLHHVFPESNIVLPMAAALAASMVLLGARSEAFRTWLLLLAAVPVLGMVVFLWFSESSELIWKSEASADESTVVRDPAPVVMLVLDELPLVSLVTPEGDINADLFPNFARLADESHWFRNAVSNSIATTDSVPIAVTGKLAEDASPTSRDHPDNLFTLLGASYELHVREPITTLCPESLCAEDDGDGEEAGRFTLTDGSLASLMEDAAIVHAHATMAPIIRGRLPAIDSQWGGFARRSGSASTAPTAEGDLAASLPLAEPGVRRPWIDEMLDFIDGFESSPPNSLHFAHLVAPHIPWELNPSGTQYDRPESLSTAVTGVENGYWVDNPRVATQGYQRHLAQLGFVDRLLGLMIDQLESTGMWDDAVVVVMADHGASFDPGDHRRWTTESNLDELYRIPLFIREPGQAEGERHDDKAYVYDILPTIVDLLDVRTDWSFEGRNLLDPALPADRPHRYDHFTGYRAALETALDALFDESAETRTFVPDQTSWPGVAAAGPYAGTVGRTIGELDTTVDDRIVVSIDEADRLDDVDPDSGIVQTVVTGRVNLPDDLAGPDVLVALDGTVAGVGFAVRDAGDVFTFSTLVAEESLHPGPNTVDLLVPGPNGTWRVGRSGAVDATEYRSSDGDLLTIANQGQRKVSIDSSKLEGNLLHIRGWSADTAEKVPPSSVLAFFGDELAYEGPPNVERGDVPQWFDSDRLAMSGYDIRIPVDIIPEDAERVTIVARFDSDAVREYATLEADR